jgi:hypothetical protein
MRFDIRVLAAGLAMSATMSAYASDDAVKPYIGRWDVTLQTPARAYSSWLDIREVNGQPKVRMVARWGHARWLPQADIVDGKLRFVSPKEEEGRNDDMVFEAKRAGDALVGETKGPDGARWTWRGVRAPELPNKQVKWGKPVKLFDGKDLTGWTPLDPAAKPWQVAEGNLVSPGNGTDLRTAGVFGDFKLHLEFNCSKGANSGVYLRGRYEVQVEDDAEPEGPTMRTGGVYGYLAPVKEVARTPGVWQTYDITFVGRWITVVLNGKTLIDHQEVPGITGGALDSAEGMPGPLVLQGSEVGHVAYRNIVITPAK